MCKELNEMTLKELWRLFPVRLVPYDENWKRQYCEIERVIKTALGTFNGAVINHIGSTAMPGIYAKDIIDVLVELPEIADIRSAALVLENCGFIRMSESAERISLNKGYAKHGFEDKVYHVHLRFKGDNGELYFRDYLNDNPAIAGEYERLKLSLKEKYEFDRDAYTDSKADFINRYTKIAKEMYKGRY